MRALPQTEGLSFFVWCSTEPTDYLSMANSIGKMRCIGATNPPCARCVKSNRECIVRLPNRNQHRNQHRLSPRLGSKSPADRPRRASQNPLVSGPSPTANHSPTSGVVASDISDCAQEILYNPESDLQSPNLDQTPLPSIFSSHQLPLRPLRATTRLAAILAPTMRFC